MNNLRTLPVKIYTYVLGAAGLGFTVSQAMVEPTTGTLIATLVFSSMTMAGHFLLKPTMKDARAAILVHANAQPIAKSAETAEVKDDAAV